MKVLVGMAISLVLCTGAHSALVGHWRFDEASGTTTADASAGNHVGTFFGNAAFVSGGVHGNALQISSAGNGHVRMGNILGMTSGSFTISAWIKTTSAEYSCVAGKHNAGSLNGYFLGIGTGSGYGAANKAHFYHSNSPGGEPRSTSNVNNNTWVHLVGVSNQAVGTQVYVNGVLEGTQGVTSIGGNARDFVVGGLYLFSGYAGYFTGLIDDVQVYDSPLSEAQISFLHQHPGWSVSFPAAYSILEGTEFEGGLERLMGSDNSRLTIFSDDNSLTASVELEALASFATVSNYQLNIEVSVARPGLAQSISLFNYVSDGYQGVDGIVAPTTDTVRTFTMTSSSANFVNADRQMRVKVAWAPINDEDPAQDGWLHRLDDVYWLNY